MTKSMNKLQNMDYWVKKINSGSNFIHFLKYYFFDFQISVKDIGICCHSSKCSKFAIGITSNRLSFDVYIFLKLCMFVAVCKSVCDGFAAA